MRKPQHQMTGRRLRDSLPLPQEYACLLTPDGFLARVSPDLERDFGPAAVMLHGQPFAELVHEGDRIGVRAALSWIRDDGAPVVFECRWHQNDGSWRWLEWTVARRPGESVLVAVGRDVTRWREDEAMALGQSRVLEQIVSGAALADVLAQVCATLEGASDRIRAAVHLVDAPSRTLRLAAAPALDEGLRRVMMTLPLDDGPGAAVAAARRRELVVSDDLAAPATLWSAQREVPLAHGLRAEWALPVLTPTGDLLAVVAAYLTVPGEPLPRERQALGAAAELVRQALTSEKRSHQSALLGDALFAAGDVVLVLDPALTPDGRRIRWVNASFERRLGVTRADVLGKTLDTLAGPESDRTALDRIQQSMDAGLPVLQDMLSYGRDGSPIWLELDVSPVRDGRGITSAWVAVGRDITGPKLADEALARSEEHVQRALAAASMATWEWDVERRSLDCSETFGPLFGLPHGAAFANFDELLERCHAEDRPLLRRTQRAVYRESGVREIEWRAVTPEGEVRWLRARLRPERAPGGWLRRVAGVVEERGEVAGPGILGDADHEADAGTIDEVEELVVPEPAMQGAGEIDELIDLSSLVAAWSPSFRGYTARAASLHLRLAPGLTSVFGDAESLRVAVVELVKNAAEGLEEGGGVISLATGTVEATRAFLASAYFDDSLPPGRYAYIEVSDTGRGMDAASVSRIFEPSFSTRGAGRGLGLPRVLAVVRAHRGAVQVYSKPDIGTTVRVLIPTEVLVRSGRNGAIVGDVAPVDVTRDRLVALTVALRQTDLAS